MKVSEKILTVLDDAIASTGTASLVVCGGSSPLEVFADLAAASIDWAKVTITLVDDRQVPADHADSNQVLIKSKLLIGNAAKARFLPLDDDVAGLSRPFDAMLLGMGPDGHFASLFPAMIEDPAYGGSFDPDAAPAIITTGPMGNPEWPRISMNMAMILQSNLIILLVNGTQKQAVLADAATNKNLPIHWLLAQAKRNVEVEIS